MRVHRFCPWVLMRVAPHVRAAEVLTNPILKLLTVTNWFEALPQLRMLFPAACKGDEKCVSPAALARHCSQERPSLAA